MNKTKKMEERKTKVCTKCGVEKALSEFHNNKETKDGRKSACKICRSKNSNNYYWKNREEVSRREKLRRKNNPDLYHKKGVKEYWKNRETIVKNQNERYKKNLEENPEKVKAKAKERYWNNIDRSREDNKRNYRVNGEQIRKSARIYSALEALNMTDAYVKRLLIYAQGLPKDSITPGLIIAKRAQLKLHRSINGVCR